MIRFLLFFIWLFLSCNHSTEDPSILLFNGTGTSGNDVKAIESILNSGDLQYRLINSVQLNDITKDELKKFRLIIIPGGNFIEMGKNLTEQTTRKVQLSVKEGMNYLGICAGGFLAGDTMNNSFNLTEGKSFPFYSDEMKGIRKEAVAISNPNGSIISNYWEDGPALSGWGDVVSKYPDGSPATVEGNYGSGFVVLTGIHPEAPESWRREFYFSTPIDSSFRYASTLITSALTHTRLAHF